MGFNYRQERKRFEEQMQENEKKYRAAGMSDERITAMHEYEEEQFRRKRTYKTHIVLEQSFEYPGLVEQEHSFDRNFDNIGTCLVTLLDNLVPGLSKKLTKQDKDILVYLSKGYSHSEIGQIFGLTQQAVSLHIAKVRKMLKMTL